MKILITGAAGYIGSELCRHYTNLPHVSKVIAYDNFSNGSRGLLATGINRKKLHTVKADILDSFLFRKALSDVDFVIHAAGTGAEYSSADKDIHRYEQVNHWGTAEVVNCIEEKKGIKLIYLSSTEVIGYSTPSEEDAKTQPISAYGSSIIRAEEEIARLIPRKRATILRLGEVTGMSSALNTESPLNKMVSDAVLLNRIQIVGNGKNTFPYTCISSITAACDAYIAGSLDSGTFNLTDGNTTLREAADTLMEAMPELEVIFVAHHFNPRSNEVLNTLPESIKKEIPIEESLASFLKSL